MGYSLNELLAPQVIAERISRIDLPGTSISRLFGWSIANFANPNPTGAVRDWMLRSGQYDIMDVSRRIATARVPGTASNLQKPQKVGEVQFTIPRAAETIPLTYEAMNNRRAQGGPANEIDRNGARYVDEQLGYIAQRFANIIEFQAASLCRGSYTFTQNGDDIEHTFTGGTQTINFQIPASNLSQLNMLGGGNIIDASWATASTDIPGHLININAAFVQLTGQGLEHVLLRGQTWNYILNNDKVKAQAGTSNSPFELINQLSPGEYTARLRALPWITFHIIDYGLELYNGSGYAWQHLLEDDHVVFMPTPNPRWVEYIRGMETVIEGPNGPKSDQYGFYSYSYPTHEPAGINLSAVFNGLPSLLRPKAIAYADVTP